MSISLVIPARYASTRLPGKPLVQIAGKELLLRVWEIAQSIVAKNGEINALVATDDQRIIDFCIKKNINVLMTSESCRNGTERVCEVAQQQNAADFYINLQGDNPLCPPTFIQAIIDSHQKNIADDVITPVASLSWEQLDRLRENKKTTPFSGTCAVMNRDHYALYFSKQIIPAIRNEEKHRGKSKRSPVFLHCGVYGYTKTFLQKISQLQDSFYEPYEGLEQLKFLEHGFKIKCAPVKYGVGEELASGVDSPEDIKRVEKLLKENE